MNNPGSEIADIFNAALVAADPCIAVLKAAKLERGYLHVGNESYDLDAYKRIVAIGAGKAAARMAMAIEELLGARISAGLIIVKAGHSVPLNIIRQVEAAHPVPDQAGVAGTREILDMARQADEETLLLCLFSGGASALLVAPVEGMSLADKQAVTSMLLKAGATINELNAVRKHLSAIKGGRLAQAAFPATVVTLILSDVIGDQLDVIASGPTVPDSSSFADAWSVIEKYHLQNKISSNVRRHLLQEVEGELKESPRQEEANFGKIQNIIIGSNRLALEAAKEKSQQLGIRAEIIKTGLHGEARDAARYLAQLARSTLKGMQPDERRCLLSGGETTVTVSGRGTGGRNQELALAFALEAEGLQGVTLLSAATDGGDGSSVAAGAMVSGDTAALARQCGIEPRQYLEDNDSYHFFNKLDECLSEKIQLISGPTGTNVMDIQIMLLTKPGENIAQD
jgi:hydroxypyruvate reductase